MIADVAREFGLDGIGGQTGFEQSPAGSVVMCMEYQLEEGLEPELSCTSHTSLVCERSNSGDYSRAVSRIENDPLHQQEEGYKWYHSYLDSTQAKTGLTKSQRASLVDSLNCVADHLGANNTALFMAVALFDSYLSAVSIPEALLQPISIACLWLAMKYDDQNMQKALTAVEVAPFMTSSDSQSLGNEAQAVQLLLQLELGVLKALNYRLASVVTIINFKHRIIHRLYSNDAAVANLNQRQQQQLYSLTSYLTEISLLEYQLLQWPPSLVAAASYALAQVLLGIRLDGKSLQDITGYRYEALHPVVQYLCSLHKSLYEALDNGAPYSVSKKYYGMHMCCVAAIPPLTTRDPRLFA